MHYAIPSCWSRLLLFVFFILVVSFSILAFSMHFINMFQEFFWLLCAPSGSSWQSISLVSSITVTSWVCTNTHVSLQTFSSSTRFFRVLVLILLISFIDFYYCDISRMISPFVFGSCLSSHELFFWCVSINLQSSLPILHSHVWFTQVQTSIFSVIFVIVWCNFKCIKDHFLKYELLMPRDIN